MTSTDQPLPHQIVVGIDGSAPSVAAARWAARQAELTGASLHAITTWRAPTYFGTPVPLPEGFDPAADATELLEKAVAAVRVEHAGIDVRALVAQGVAGQVLVEASKDAELLVVGRRGHGELAGILLGSVSEHCVTHAHCPVVVVRH